MEGLEWLCVLWHMLFVQKVTSAMLCVATVLKFRTFLCCQQNLLCEEFQQKLLLQASATYFLRTLNFTGSVQEAIHIHRRGLQVVRDSEFMNLDDDVLEKMMIDLAELLHVTGR